MVMIKTLGVNMEAIIYSKKPFIIDGPLIVGTILIASFLVICFVVLGWAIYEEYMEPADFSCLSECYGKICNVTIQLPSGCYRFAENIIEADRDVVYGDIRGKKISIPFTFAQQYTIITDDEAIITLKVNGTKIVIVEIKEKEHLAHIFFPRPPFILPFILTSN